MKLKTAFKVFSFIFFSTFFLLPVCKAEVKFSDSFEYNDSPTNHGWISDGTSDGNDFITTDEHSKSGNRSLKGYILCDDYKRIFLRYRFEDNEFGKTISPNDLISLKVSFYDSYAVPGKFKRFLRKNFGNIYRKLFEKNGLENNKTSQFHVSFNYLDQDQRYLTISSSGNDYSYNKKIGWETINLRTQGWHEVEVSIKNNMLSLLFDGKPVLDNPHYVSKLESFVWSSNIIDPNSEVYSWIDDVEFSRK